MRLRTCMATALAAVTISAMGQEKVVDKLYVGGTPYAADEVRMRIFPHESLEYARIFINDRLTGQYDSATSLVENENGEEVPLLCRVTVRDKNVLGTPRVELSGLLYHRTVSVSWTPVEGAAGYEVELTPYYVWPSDIPAGESMVFTVGAEETYFDTNDVDYYRWYHPRVRAVHATNPEYNSEWSGRTGFFIADIVGARYVSRDVPKVIDLEDYTDNTVVVSLNRSSEGVENPYLRKDNDGNLIVTHLSLRSFTQGVEVPQEYDNYAITADDLAAGKVTLSGLQENTQYLIAAYDNENPDPREVRYNDLSVRTKGGEPGPPIDVEGDDLGVIIDKFYADPNMVEGQTLYLTGDKTYYLYEASHLTLGFTLETKPEDVAAGKRAKVHMMNPSTLFLIGSSEQMTKVGSIIFRNIDFDVPEALNYGAAREQDLSSTNNYFVNCLSNNKDVAFESFEVYNCTFRHFIRGFFRVQGNNKKVIHKLVIDGCLFSDCGYYASNGNSYSWFAGDGKQAESNLYEDFSFTNNTMYDCPMVSLMTDNNNQNFDESVKWNIKIENNTFFNFNIRASGRYILNLRYVPGGSHFSLQRNLFVTVGHDGDERELYMSGSDIRSIMGSGEFTYTIKDNYSASTKTDRIGDDMIFSGGAFSATKNSFGAFPDAVKDCTVDDLKVKQLVDADGNALMPQDIFNNALPPYKDYKATEYTALDHAAPENIMEALKYKNVPAVVVEKNLGDPRWRD
ncbi:MAG: hypothetical protein NC039_05125 [Muribaculaceae bacterium]|nr:hypothetical protein [Muribaculaceae bacterium]